MDFVGNVNTFNTRVYNGIFDFFHKYSNAFNFICLFDFEIISSNKLFFSHFQSKQNKLEALNQRAQELMRLADSTNHTRIDDEITDLNNDWKKKLHELENHIETLTVLSNHWQDFDKRIESIESQLNRLDEKISNTEFVVKSKQHLLDTKDIYRVSKNHTNRNVKSLNSFELVRKLLWFGIHIIHCMVSLGQNSFTCPPSLSYHFLTKLVNIDLKLCCDLILFKHVASFNETNNNALNAFD